MFYGVAVWASAEGITHFTHHCLHRRNLPHVWHTLTEVMQVSDDALLTHPVDLLQPKMPLFLVFFYLHQEPEDIKYIFQIFPAYAIILKPTINE